MNNKQPFSVDDLLSHRDLIKFDQDLNIYSLKGEEKAETFLITTFLIPTLVLFFFSNPSLICELNIFNLKHWQMRFKKKCSLREILHYGKETNPVNAYHIYFIYLTDRRFLLKLQERNVHFFHKYIYKHSVFIIISPNQQGRLIISHKFYGTKIITTTHQKAKLSFHVT